MTREFDPWQSHTAHEELIGANCFRSFKAYTASGGDDVVLVNAVTTDANGSDQHSVFVKRHTTRKDLKAIWQSGNC